MRYIFLVLALVIFGTVQATDKPVDEGRTIFSARCAGCHNVNKVLTGPALSGVDQRHTIDWIINFVHSSQTVIKGGNKEAMELFQKFNNIPMPDHADLSAENIKSIVAYIKAESKDGATEKAPFAKPERLHPNYTPVAITNYGFFLAYLGAVALLVGALLLAVQLKDYSREKDDLEM